MSTGKVGVIRKIDSTALLLPYLAYFGNEMYQGSGLQQRNQARWKTGKDAVRRAGRVGIRSANQALRAPGRAVRAIRDELSGRQYQHGNRSPEYQEAARQGWYTTPDPPLLDLSPPRPTNPYIQANTDAIQSLRPYTNQEVGANNAP